MLSDFILEPKVREDLDNANSVFGIDSGDAIRNVFILHDLIDMKKLWLGPIDDTYYKSLNDLRFNLGLKPIER